MKTPKIKPEADEAFLRCEQWDRDVCMYLSEAQDLDCLRRKIGCWAHARKT